MSKTNSGRLGEDFSCDFLIKKGYTILARNYHSRYGEIDIIAETKAKNLAIIEVKTRKENSLVSAEESVTLTKQKRIILTTEEYLNENQDKQNHTITFDVIAITTKDSKIFEVLTIKHYRNAFVLNKKNASYYC